MALMFKIDLKQPQRTMTSYHADRVLNIMICHTLVPDPIKVINSLNLVFDDMYILATQRHPRSDNRFY